LFQVRESVPDETTILNFRHLLEHHALGESLFQAVGSVRRTICIRHDVDWDTKRREGASGMLEIA
jgi:hypothetical protein